MAGLWRKNRSDRGFQAENDDLPNMSVPESFQTVAEIGVAIAAFSGLIVALRKDSGSMTPVQKYRLQVLLLLAFGSMFLSLLPDLLLTYGISVDVVWFSCSSALALFSMLFLVWWVSKSRQFRLADPGIFNWYAFSRMLTGHILILLLQTTYLFSIVDLEGAAVVLTGLVWYLLHSVQQFTRMLFIRARSDLAT